MSSQESDGAEESEPRKAGHARMRTDGEGPSPLARWDHRYPANAQAVHGECTVELEKWEQTLHGYPWRTTKGAAPCAVKVCAAGRGAESLMQSGEVRREASGSSDLPEGESRRGQEHVGEAGAIGRRVGWCFARPARYGES